MLGFDEYILKADAMPVDVFLDEASSTHFCKDSKHNNFKNILENLHCLFSVKRTY